VSWDRAKEACNCDHQCAFHQFKARKVGEGDTCLLVTRNLSTMTETSYVMWPAEAAEWSKWFSTNDIDVTKFESLLLSGMTLQQAKEAMS
jgi:hypothetical protein